jgi:hypothetical protein
VSPFDHVPRLSSLSIRRAEPEPLPSGLVGPAQTHRSSPSNPCVALRERGPAGPAATPQSLSCDHLNGGRALMAPFPPRRGGGRPCRRSALLKAAPPPGTHPASGPLLAALLLGTRGPCSGPRSRPRRRRSSSLRPACMWRRRRGSTLRAARALAASLLRARGPGSDPRALPPISASPFVHAGRPGPLSRRPRAGPAGPLRWAAALSPPAVPQSPPLRSTAGGRRRALPGQTRHLRLRLRPPGAAHGLVLARPAGSGSGSIEVPYHHLLEAMLARRWGPRPDGDGVSSPCEIGVEVH